MPFAATEDSLGKMGRHLLQLTAGFQRLLEWLSQGFDQVREFVVQNPVAVITTLVSIAGSALLGRWFWLRDQRRVEEQSGRTDHFDALKREVLQPMLDYLDEHLSPITGHQFGNVGLCRKQLPSSSTRLGEPPSFEEVLCIKESSEASFGYYLDPSEKNTIPEPSHDRLTEDLKQNHFPGMFRRWEAILKRFQEYNKSCLEYVEAIRTEIMAESLLPEFDLRSEHTKWVNARAIAIVIYFQQLGLRVFDLRFKVEGDLRSWVYKNTHTLARVAVGEVLPLEMKVNNLTAQRSRIDHLIQKGEALKRDASGLRAEIEEVRLAWRLPGGCQYL